MILVTTGTHSQQFDRLAQEVDRLIAVNSIKENVVMQIGYSNYIPRHARWFKFIDYSEMMKLIEKSTVVITHGGIGSIFLSLRFNKKTIVVPRREKFQEHTNDHQLEIVKELSKQGRIIPVYDVSQLSSAIKKSKNFRPVKSKQSKKILITIDEFLNSL